MGPLEWSAAGLGVTGAALLAIRVRGSGWGFVLFLGSSMAWTLVGAQEGRVALVVQSAVFTAINLLGIWRWLWRRNPAPN